MAIEKIYTINRNNTDALMFDLDGTLTNNMPLHRQAWRLFGGKYGLEFTDEWFHQNCSGKTSRHIITQFFGEVTPEQQQAFFAERFAFYQDIFRESGREIEGLTPFLHEVGKTGIKLALATSGSPPTRKLQLEKLGLEDAFDVVIGSEDVTNTKPHPEPYLLGAKALRFSPQRCIAFEDSPTGVLSAQNAGMEVVGVLSTHTADELSGVDTTIDDYTEIRIAR
jgi:HAD superfamily hydrolase (TIGR01509 family)